jgi:hypothetical protein
LSNRVCSREWLSQVLNRIVESGGASIHRLSCKQYKVSHNSSQQDSLLRQRPKKLICQSHKKKYLMEKKLTLLWILAINKRILAQVMFQPKKHRSVEQLLTTVRKTYRHLQRQKVAWVQPIVTSSSRNWRLLNNVYNYSFTCLLLHWL